MKKIILGLLVSGILFSGNIYAKNIVLQTGFMPMCEKKSVALPYADMMALSIASGDTNKMKSAYQKISNDGCVVVQVSQYKEIVVNVISDEKVKHGKTWSSLKRIQLVSIDGEKYGDKFWVADILDDIK